MLRRMLGLLLLLSGGFVLAQVTTGTISGTVKDTTGAVLPGAQVIVLNEATGISRTVQTDAEGRYSFWTVKPVSYPIPTDGPVGKMLLLMGRHPYRPAHTHMIISAPGYEPVTTHVFVEGDKYIDSDAVFGVKNSLVAEFARHESGVASDGRRMNKPYYTVSYDFGLARSQ